MKWEKELEKLMSNFLSQYLIIDSHFRREGNGIKTANKLREQLFESLFNFIRSNFIYKADLDSGDYYEMMVNKVNEESNSDTKQE